jgi:hypothetical protein
VAAVPALIAVYPELSVGKVRIEQRLIYRFPNFAWLSVMHWWGSYQMSDEVECHPLLALGLS